MGGLTIASSLIGIASSSSTQAYLETGLQLGAFETSADESTEAIDRLAELAAKGEINTHELTKAMASLVFKEGQGHPSFIEFDKLGSPTFKNDKERFSAAMVYQLFKSHVPPLENVLRLTEGSAS